jgi:hypothetical protein
MRLNNPWFSPLGFVLTSMMLIILGIAIRRGGHLMFSPGALSALSGDKPTLNGFTNHAAFEKDCQACHQPLKHAQATLCTDCHAGILNQISSQSGTHGVLPASANCAGCHPDHRGADFDLLEPALEKFDHAFTDFSLVHHQVNFDSTPMLCGQCHEDRDFLGSNHPCTECHMTAPGFNQTRHILEYGKDCLGCHDGQDRMIPFNHGETQFPLEGQHANAACIACHQRRDFQLTPKNCHGCHEEPVVHSGLFEQDCAACHVPMAWSPAEFEGELFDHSNTRFKLSHHEKDFSGGSLSCVTCHVGDYQNFPNLTCTNCHAEEDLTFIQAHELEFGSACLDCHDGVDRMKDFDHARVFALSGGHEEIECSACHIDENWTGISQKCAACHAEPEIHFGLFGLECEYCHTTQAWAPAQLKIHIFPLDHGNPLDQDCSVCHVENYIDYTCYGCHEHEPDEILEDHLKEGFAASEIPFCIDCHPTGLVEEDRE